MSEKIQAESVVLVLHRKDSHWSGEAIVNGDAVSGCNGPSFWGVLDAILEGPFQNDLSGDSIYTLGEWNG